MMNNQQGRSTPVRVLHIVGAMNRGGVETWLMHVLRTINRTQVHMDFLVHVPAPGTYDDEIRSLGSQVLPCAFVPQPRAYAQRFRQILRDHGPYDVVHSHVHYFSGYPMRLAHAAGVPIRIVHSHLDTAVQDAGAVLHRQAYLALMRRWIARHSSVRLAASRKAGNALFGDPARLPWHVLYCGIDLQQFVQPIDCSALRASVGIPHDAFVVGHVGRFAEQKNHTFLIDIFAEVVKREPRAWLLLLGDGPLRPAIARKVDQLNLTERVVFAGDRPGVAYLMRGAMNRFVLPSLHEGLPLVGLEAQAAGLRSVVSTTVSEELDLVKPLIQRLRLQQTAAQWAEYILARRDMPPPVTQHDALQMMQQSAFNIEQSVSRLQQIYASA